MSSYAALYKAPAGNGQMPPGPQPQPTPAPAPSPPPLGSTAASLSKQRSQTFKAFGNQMIQGQAQQQGQQQQQQQQQPPHSAGRAASPPAPPAPMQQQQFHQPSFPPMQQQHQQQQPPQQHPNAYGSPYQPYGHHHHSQSMHQHPTHSHPHPAAAALSNPYQTRPLFAPTSAAGPPQPSGPFFVQQQGPPPPMQGGGQFIPSAGPYMQHTMFLPSHAPPPPPPPMQQPFLPSPGGNPYFSPQAVHPSLMSFGLQNGTGGGAPPGSAPSFVKGVPIQQPQQQQQPPLQLQQQKEQRPISNPASASAGTKRVARKASVQPPATSSGLPSSSSAAAAAAPAQTDSPEVKVVRVKVVARVRPLLAHEQGRGGECVAFPSSKSLSLTLPIISSAAAAGAASAAAAAAAAISAPMGSAQAAARSGLGSASGLSDPSSPVPPALSSAAPAKTTTRTFEFDSVLDPLASQAQIFESSGVKEYIESALQGFSSTVFAYGQTGSGKTYSMSGEEEKEGDGGKRGGGGGGGERSRDASTDGLIPRSIVYLLSELQNGSRAVAAATSTPYGPGKPGAWTLRAQYCEVYNECIRDLLATKVDAPTALPGQPQSGVSIKSLPLRQSLDGGFFVEGATSRTCETLEDVMGVAALAHKNRVVRSHALNQDSSRSHAIFILNIEREIMAPAAATAASASASASAAAAAEQQQTMVPCMRYGKLIFVDLAGSENLKTSKSSGSEAIKETSAINTSLFTLGAVISLLSDIAKGRRPVGAHVPFRNSVLTKLLMESLGGRGMAMMIACISPSVLHAQESLRTLMYADRARNIRTKPTINNALMSNNKDEIISALRRDVKQLEQENSALRNILAEHNITAPDFDTIMQHISSSSGGGSNKSSSSSSAHGSRGLAHHQRSPSDFLRSGGGLGLGLGLGVGARNIGSAGGSVAGDSSPASEWMRLNSRGGTALKSRANLISPAAFAENNDAGFDSARSSAGGGKPRARGLVVERDTKGQVVSVSFAPAPALTGAESVEELRRMVVEARSQVEQLAQDPQQLQVLLVQAQQAPQAGRTSKQRAAGTAAVGSAAGSRPKQSRFDTAPAASDDSDVCASPLLGAVAGKSKKPPHRSSPSDSDAGGDANSPQLFALQGQNKGRFKGRALEPPAAAAVDDGTSVSSTPRSVRGGSGHTRGGAAGSANVSFDDASAPGFLEAASSPLSPTTSLEKHNRTLSQQVAHLSRMVALLETGPDTGKNLADDYDALSPNKRKAVSETFALKKSNIRMQKQMLLMQEHVREAENKEKTLAEENEKLKAALAAAQAAVAASASAASGSSAPPVSDPRPSVGQVPIPSSAHHLPLPGGARPTLSLAIPAPGAPTAKVAKTDPQMLSSSLSTSSSASLAMSASHTSVSSSSTSFAASPPTTHNGGVSPRMLALAQHRSAHHQPGASQQQQSQQPFVVQMPFTQPAHPHAAFIPSPEPSARRTIKMQHAGATESTTAAAPVAAASAKPVEPAKKREATAAHLAVAAPLAAVAVAAAAPAVVAVATKSKSKQKAKPQPAPAPVPEPDPEPQPEPECDVAVAAQEDEAESAAAAAAIAEAELQAEADAAEAQAQADADAAADAAAASESPVEAAFDAEQDPDLGLGDDDAAAAAAQDEAEVAAQLQSDAAEMEAMSMGAEEMDATIAAADDDEDHAADAAADTQQEDGQEEEPQAAAEDATEEAEEAQAESTEDQVEDAEDAEVAEAATEPADNETAAEEAEADADADAEAEEAEPEPADAAEADAQAAEDAADNADEQDDAAEGDADVEPEAEPEAEAEAEEAEAEDAEAEEEAAAEHAAV